MKNFKVYLCVVFLMVSFALQAENTDPVYLKAMEKALVKLDSAKSVSDLQQIRNQFERISGKYNEEWLPVYYITYSTLQMIYFNPKGDKNEAILADAKKYLDQLGSFKETDKSEFLTLNGHYYTAMIMLNPEANGVKYFGDVLRFYDEAKEANGDNPRPVFLSAVFEQNLPEFVRPKRDFCEEVAKAKELFKKQDKTVLKPYWGESFIKMFAGKCDN